LGLAVRLLVLVLVELLLTVLSLGMLPVHRASPPR
jgi:hypothetical protein